MVCAMMAKLIAGVAVLGVMSLTAFPAGAMDAYVWKKRPLVVFAAAAGDAALAQQTAIVAGNRSGFIERDMVIVYVVGDAVTSELGGGPGRSAATLRARFGVGPRTFRAVLVGKDGGVKLTSGSPLSAARLFSTIDAMPMRADEMRRRK